MDSGFDYAASFFSIAWLRASRAMSAGGREVRIDLLRCPAADVFFDFIKDLGHNISEALVVRRHLQCRVHDKTPPVNLSASNSSTVASKYCSNARKGGSR
jgi:hypothetical protein